MQNVAIQMSPDLQAMLARVPVPVPERTVAPRHETAEIRQINPGSAAVPFTIQQRAALQALHLAMNEGGVFVAMTGGAGAGKTIVLNAALKAREMSGSICVHIPRPDRISAEIITEVDESIRNLKNAAATPNRHVVLAIDNAHAIPDDLLALLNRFAKATMRDSAPQLIFVGEPEFWHRIEAPAYEALAARLAMRVTLRPPANA